MVKARPAAARPAPAPRPRPPTPREAAPGAPPPPLASDCPPRPPPPKIFGEDDDPSKEVELPPAPEDLPSLHMPRRNPKLYELVGMSQENSSFWWDTVDTTKAAYEEEDDYDFEGFEAATPEVDFESSISMSVVRDDDGTVAWRVDRLCSSGACGRTSLA